MNPNIKDFQQSITQELDVIKNRVRSLIGDAHWGEEGRYKEIILHKVIKRFLPSNLSVGTGFVIDETKSISKQLDIIIYDNTLPLFFYEDNFIITPSDNVRGIIEVKSNIDSASRLGHIIEKLDNSLISIFTDKQLKKLFVGIFSFSMSFNIDSLSDVLSKNTAINYVSLGNNYFIRKWLSKDRKQLNIIDNESNTTDFYNVYEIDNLSHSYFISNLVTQTCNIKAKKHSWFYFPIEGTKEIYKRKTISCQYKNSK